MAFLVKIPKAIVSVILNCFKTNQMGFEQVFDNPTFKHMDGLQKQFQSLVDYVLNHFRIFAMFSTFWH